MKEDEKIKNKKAGMRWSIVAAVVVATLVILANFPNIEVDDGEWHVIWKGNLASAAENNPGAGVSGWMSTFQLDYAETPGTCLLSNATNGAYDGWGNVSGYVSADDTETDLASEDPFYFVVRCRFNETVCGDAGVLQKDRVRCALTVSGDETISDVAQDGDDTGADTNGGAAVSYNGSAWLYVNFYWDDNSDGYRITDDGSLAWNITISAKY